MARRIALLEADLERAEERASTGESKIVELEEELRVVGNNLKSLEVSEEKALQKEETYEMQIRQMTNRLQEAEARAEFAERSVQKLQKEVDRLEDELLVEREKNHMLQEEVETTLKDLQSIACKPSLRPTTGKADALNLSTGYNLIVTLPCSHTPCPLTDELVQEKEKYKAISDELDQTFSELTGY
ncbi:hypothetical protein MTO96_027247 [Rhipicephalus appendiculatus]